MRTFSSSSSICLTSGRAIVAIGAMGSSQDGVAFDPYVPSISSIFSVIDRNEKSGASTQSPSASLSFISTSFAACRSRMSNMKPRSAVADTTVNTNNCAWRAARTSSTSAVSRALALRFSSHSTTATAFALLCKTDVKRAILAPRPPVLSLSYLRQSSR